MENREIKDFLDWRRSFFGCMNLFFQKLDLSLVKSDADLIISVLDHLCQNEMTMNIIEPPKIGKKSLETAMAFKRNGDEYMKESKAGRFDKTVEAYSASIAFAPPGSRGRSLAFACRAAVLYQAGAMEGCASDLERALKEDYPDHLRAMIHLRQAILYEAINCPAKVYTAYADARKWAKTMGSKMQKIVKKRISEQQSGKILNNSQFWIWEHKSITPKIEDKNRTFRGASSAIELKYSEEFGRHVVATRDIKPGETLMALTPFTKVVMMSMRYKCCWNCGLQTWSSTPCDQCAQVVFCSDSCKNIAMKSFHEVECPLMEIFAGKGMNESELINLRLAILTASKGRRIGNNLQYSMNEVNAETDPLKKGFVKGVFDSSKPESLFSMDMDPDRSMTNKQKRKKMEIIMTNSILKSYFLATKTNFFGEKLSGNLSTLKDNEKFIDSIRFLNVCKLLSDANAIVKFCPVKTGKGVPTFQTIVPGLGFFNHSCNPNMTRHFQDGYLVVTALYPIKKGEQIFDNYAGLFHEVPRKERLKTLFEREGFTCECEACKNKWPTGLALSKTASTPDYEKMILVLNKMKNKVNFALASFDFSRARDRRDLLVDLSEDYDIIIKLISYFYRRCETNCVEVQAAVYCLKAYLRLMERPYVLLD